MESEFHSIERKMEMYLIAGLGNPGREYENTRHNAGFMVIDRLADMLGCEVTGRNFRGFV